MNSADRACPVCADTSRSNLFADYNVNAAQLDGYAFASRKSPEYMHHRLLRCTRCDLIYASPAPKQEWLHEAYREAAFDSVAEEGFAAKSYARALRSMLREPVVGEHLDIGAGAGSLMQEMINLGCSSVLGIEPSSAPIAQASEQIRPHLRQAVFDGSQFEPDSFDVVTCCQTLEHLSDPLAICTDVRRLLRPGGVFFVADHDFRALSARILGKRSPIFDVEHMQLFSRRSLEEMLRRAGFTDIRIASLKNSYPIGYWAKLLPLPRRIKSGVLRTLDATQLADFVVGVRAGNIVGLARA